MLPDLGRAFGGTRLTSWGLYVEPNAAQIVQLAEQAAAGTLKLAPEPLALSEGSAAFARVVTGGVGGKKAVLTFA